MSSLKTLTLYSTQVLARHVAGKEPALRPLHSPPRPQDLQQLWGDHHVTILSGVAGSSPRTERICADARVPATVEVSECFAAPKQFAQIFRGDGLTGMHYEAG